MIDDRTAQRSLARRGVYAGEIDGIFGDASRRAMRALLANDGHEITRWIDPRCRIALDQHIMAEAGIAVGAIDGHAGPQTRMGLEQWQDRLRSKSPPSAEIIHQPAIFPRQRAVRRFYGEPGAHQVSLDLPFAMRLAWDHETIIRRFSVHDKVHDSAARAFADWPDSDYVGLLETLKKRGMRLGGNTGQYALRLAMAPFRVAVAAGPEVLIAAAGKAFDEDGRLIDERYQKALAGQMEALRAAVR